MEKQDSLRLVVAEAGCRYKRPAHYEDELTVETTVRKIGSRGLTFEYAVRRGETILATGFTKHIVTSSSGKTTRLPEKYLKLLDRS